MSSQDVLFPPSTPKLKKKNRPRLPKSSLTHARRKDPTYEHTIPRQHPTQTNLSSQPSPPVQAKVSSPTTTTTTEIESRPPGISRTSNARTDTAPYKSPTPHSASDCICSSRRRGEPVSRRRGNRSRLLPAPCRRQRRRSRERD